MAKRLGIKLLGILLWGTLVQAQAPVWPVAQWTPEGLLVSRRFQEAALLKDGRRKDLQRPAPEEPQASNSSLRLARMTGGLDPRSEVYFVNGHYWYTAYRLQEENPVAVLQRLGLKGWEPVARFSFRNRTMLPTVLPLENGRFLVANFGLSQWRKEGEVVGSPMAVLRLRDGTQDLQLHDVIDGVWDGLERNPKLARSFLRCVATDAFFVFCNEEYGLFWCFSLGNGMLRRKVRLFDEVKDEFINRNSAAGLITGWHPTKDGTILISARAKGRVEEFLKEAQKPMRVQQSASGLSGNREALLQVVQAAARERDNLLMSFATVHWYSFDPATGTIRSCEAPTGARPYIQSQQDERLAFWLPNADGTVTYHDPSSLERQDKVQKEQQYSRGR